MNEPQSASSVHQITDEDLLDPAFVANLQQSAKLANENCDRAVALAHKLSGQLREAHDRINQLELEAAGLMRLRAEAKSVVAEARSGANARVNRMKREADERIARAEAEAENRVNRLQEDLKQIRQQADRAMAEANARIERIKVETNERIASSEAEAFKAHELVNQLRAETNTTVAKLKSDADARVDGMKREADERIADAKAEANERVDRAHAEIEDQVRRLKSDFAQAKQRADRAEQWLTVIHRQIEGTVHDSSHRKDQKSDEG